MYPILRLVLPYQIRDGIWWQTKLEATGGSWRLPGGDVPRKQQKKYGFTVGEKSEMEYGGKQNWRLPEATGGYWRLLEAT